jgi:hypothetical protein
MKEAPFLLAMDGIVGRVKVEDDPVRRRGIRVQEGIDEELPYLSFVPLDTLVAIRFARLPASQLKAS